MSKRIKGGITAPKGFLAAGIHSGIKKTKQLDLALIVSEKPGPIAGIFTSNKLPAAPVILDRLHLKKGMGQAVIINSGNANAFTGTEGLAHAREMGRGVADQLQIPFHQVFVGSTGVIGVPLPMPAVRNGIPVLVAQLRKAGYREAAQAIMTTDTRLKEIAVQQRIAGKMVTIGGIAKGSGMIHPDMATMLAYLTTDAVIDQKTLQATLRTVANQTFNCISVDGETSTNDTVLCLANGLAGNTPIRGSSSAQAQFQNLLHEVCHFLAMEICRDGEGATKIIKIEISGASSQKAAKQFAQTLATSPLVKTAIFGADPNWGRIIAALGRAGLPLRPDRIVIAFNGLPIVKDGQGLGPRVEGQIQKIMRRPSFTISVSLGMGTGSSTIWTTDLTYDYIKINASYRS
ncbi:MAG: bifunctional glutamate N-acetyltransferase/amino-acid acetyltransferase ArgJ [Nitrospirota bacterium]|nr:bifunctional glutamate N-acetyltransferase/amino-acid acetyltransferase ArgJ [Nitrospirota bacterium]MDH4360911.1 bifunctional glutamate N-acetyltransferase/amino-acid acetyltransferase ArgJ [Nitrospirota bacterium]